MDVRHEPVDIPTRRRTDERDFVIRDDPDHVERPVVVVRRVLAIKWFASEDALRAEVVIRLRQVDDEVSGVQILGARVDQQVRERRRRVADIADAWAARPSSERISGLIVLVATPP